MERLFLNSHSFRFFLQTRKGMKTVSLLCTCFHMLFALSCHEMLQGSVSSIRQARV